MLLSSHTTGDFNSNLWNCNCFSSQHWRIVGNRHFQILSALPYMNPPSLSQSPMCLPLCLNSLCFPSQVPLILCVCRSHSWHWINWAVRGLFQSSRATQNKMNFSSGCVSTSSSPRLCLLCGTLCLPLLLLLWGSFINEFNCVSFVRPPAYRPVNRLPIKPQPEKYADKNKRCCWTEAN